MFTSASLDINSKGNLSIGGCDCVELAKKYGTPLYVLDEALIRSNCRIYKESLEKFYGENSLVIYASKAFCTKSIYKILDEEGFGADVVSGGEFFTAMKAGFPAKKIFFHGNNKSPDELEYTISNGVGRIVVDNFSELSLVSEICKSKGIVQKILLRVTPGVDAHTHSFISTGQIDSKFGIAIDTGEAIEFVKAAINTENVCVAGIHCHIGSQIFDYDPFAVAAEKMMDFVSEIKTETGYEVEELDLGGGFGIKYTSQDDPIPYSEFMENISVIIKKLSVDRGIKLPFIIMEPGRSLVGAAGITLYTAGVVKEIPGVRKYVSVDGGMGDNPRYALYEAEYDAVIANKPDAPYDDKVTLVGKCCESGDIIINNRMLQKIETGDIVAVLSTGAYNYSMSSNYNRIPRPAVVMVNDGCDRVVVERETYEDLIRNDR